MPIKAYVGLQRSGKTYEVTSVVIYNALKIGRRVVSNIAGLNQDEYYRLLSEDGFEVDKLGTICKVSNEQVLAPDFWLNEDDFKAGKPTFLQAGDFLVLDEIWRFWDGFNSKDSLGNKMPMSVLNFFRMHGHFTHPVTGLTCEMAFITQDIMDCGRKLRGVIDETYRTTKLTAVGSTKRYRVDVFTRSRITTKPTKSLFGAYNERYFNLYKSHSQQKEGDADPREVSTDKRGNILSGKLFIFGVPLALIILFLCWRVVSKFFHHEPEKVENAQIVANNLPLPKIQGVAQPSKPSVDTAWRIHGHYVHNGLLTIVLVADDGSYRYVLPHDFEIFGLSLEANIDGSKYINSFPRQNNSTNAPIL